MTDGDAVLLVDDEAVVVDVLAIALRKKNLTVEAETTVTQALAHLQRRRFAVLLVDKNLPDGSGLDLIEKVRVLQPDCACVVMTGYPNADSILKALRLGAVDYLEKPFPNLAIIQEKVVSLVARQKVIAERDSLLRRLKELQAQGGQEDFQETAQIALLQQALEVAQEDAKSATTEARAAMQRELDEANGRLDALKFRHSRMMTAMRQAAAFLANILDSHRVNVEAERELREARRVLTSVLDESARSLTKVE